MTVTPRHVLLKQALEQVRKHGLIDEVVTIMSAALVVGVADLAGLERRLEDYAMELSAQARGLEELARTVAKESTTVRAARLLLEQAPAQAVTPPRLPEDSPAPHPPPAQGLPCL